MLDIEGAMAKHGKFVVKKRSNRVRRDNDLATLKGIRRVNQFFGSKMGNYIFFNKNNNNQKKKLKRSKTQPKDLTSMNIPPMLRKKFYKMNKKGLIRGGTGKGVSFVYIVAYNHSYKNTIVNIKYCIVDKLIDVKNLDEVKIRNFYSFLGR